MRCSWIMSLLFVCIGCQTASGNVYLVLLNTPEPMGSLICTVDGRKFQLAPVSEGKYLLMRDVVDSHGELMLLRFAHGRDLKMNESLSMSQLQRDMRDVEMGMDLYLLVDL